MHPVVKSDTQPEGCMPRGEESSRMDSSLASSPAVKSFLAGSFSGTCSTIILQPLDLIKTRLQCSQSRSVLSLTVQVIRSEGFFALWRGLMPSLTRTVPGIGVYFSTLHTLQSKFTTSDPWPRASMNPDTSAERKPHTTTEPKPHEAVILGFTARSVSVVALLPATVIKARFESGKFGYTSQLQALTSIVRTEGVQGLYRGLWPTLLRDAPFSGLYLLFYTQSKQWLLTDMPSPLGLFSCGIIGGTLAAVVTQPVDVVKTYVQTQGFRNNREAVKHIYRTYGLAGFERGILPRTVRRALMAALAWTVYEEIMIVLGIK